MKIRIEFEKIKAYARVLSNYYEIMQMTLDTADFVLDKFDKKIKQIMFKELKHKINEVNRLYDELTRRKKKVPKEIVEVPSNDKLSS